MINLYERGKIVGTIQKFEFHHGNKDIINVPLFGGRYYVQGRREPDVVSFQLPFFHDAAGIHELVDEEGNVLEVTFVSMAISNNTSFVRAYVESIRKT